MNKPHPVFISHNKAMPMIRSKLKSWNSFKRTPLKHQLISEQEPEVSHLTYLFLTVCWIEARSKYLLRSRVLQNSLLRLVWGLSLLSGWGSNL